MDRIVLFFIITFFFFLVKGTRQGDKNGRIHFIVLSSVALILASALRGLSVGPDTHQYFIIFEQVKYYSFDELWQSIISDGPITKDPFYWMFQKVFQVFSSNYNAFLGLVAIMFCTSLGIFLYKNKLSLNELYVSYVFYLGLFYGFYSITGIRQTIAVSFTIYAYLFLLNKMTFLFLIFIFIAYLFHSSAIIFVLSFFLIRVKNVKLLLFSVLVLLPIIYIFRYQIFTQLIYMTDMEDRFGAYMKESYRGSLSVLALYLAVVVGIILKLRSIPTDSEMLNHIKNFSICIFGLPLLFVSGSAGRITMYFSVAMFVLVPYLTTSIRIKGNYFFVTLFMFLLIVIAYHDQPYVFYWNEITPVY